MQLAASPSLFRSAEFEAFLIFHELSLLGWRLSLVGWKPLLLVTRSYWAIDFKRIVLSVYTLYKNYFFLTNKRQVATATHGDRPFVLIPSPLALQRGQCAARSNRRLGDSVERSLGDTTVTGSGSAAVSSGDGVKKQKSREAGDWLPGEWW